MRFWPLARRPRPPAAAAEPPLVYDVGMNNGDDCAYYLAKGCRVVAIEANPALCVDAALRFADDLTTGRLTILNLGIADTAGQATFHVHRTNSVLSTFLAPADRTGYTATLSPAEFEPIPMELRRLSDVVAQYGSPFYVKIDIEGFDERCLADLHRAGLRPPYLSAEAHDIGIHRQLVQMGYRQFKMIAGETVASEFARHRIRRVDGRPIRHDFPAHSAGPFGEDIPGPWLDERGILQRWHGRGAGWFDLHARAPA